MHCCRLPLLFLLLLVVECNNAVDRPVSEAILQFYKLDVLQHTSCIYKGYIINRQKVEFKKILELKRKGYRFKKYFFLKIRN